MAHPVYNKRYDDYFVMLDIAGNADDKNKNVTFRVYDASTGTVWPMVKTSRDIDFNVRECLAHSRSLWSLTLLK